MKNFMVNYGWSLIFVALLCSMGLLIANKFSTSVYAQGVSPWFEAQEEVQTWFHQETPDAFALLTIKIQEMLDHANGTVNVVGIQLRDDIAEASGAIDNGEDISTLDQTREDAKDFVTDLRRSYTEASVDLIVPGLRTLLKDNLVELE